MTSAATIRPRRLLAGLAVVAVSLGVAAGPVAALGVTRSDLDRAETAVEAAEAKLAEVRAALSAAEASRARLVDTLQRLEERRRGEAAAAADRETELRTRIATLYMSAGGRSTAVVVIGDVTAYTTRGAYLAAVADDDRSALNRFALSLDEIADLSSAASEQLEVESALIGALESDLAGREAAVVEARARYAEVKGAWDRQEAARIAAEEAELRRREAELAAQLATTTTTTPRSTTTTTRPPDYGHDPTRGAEQWRPLVQEVFADWGLDRERCATRNGVEFCVPGQVDNAIRIMACESNGVPYAENRYSGAAGLFQNLPYYWPSRVERVRAYYSSMASLPADASIWNPEHNTIVAAMLVWESRESLLGTRSWGGVSPAVWPEFNWDRFEASGYGYSAWGKGPNPWGHWTCGARLGIFDNAWVHPWAERREP